MELIESHAHLDFDAFDHDRGATLERARRAGVVRTVNIALHPDHAQRTLALAEQNDDVVAAVGIHPHASAECEGRVAATVERLRQLAAHPKVVALGEMGLDYYRDYAPAPLQREVFEAQLDLAVELDLPVIIHARAADKEVLDILGRYRPQRVVLHCFSGDEVTARTAAARGYYIGVGGVLTFPNAERLRRIVSTYPRDRVLLETDCPFLAPQPRRGRRNEPAFLTWVAEALGEVWNMAPDQAAAGTSCNSRRFFGFPDAGRGPRGDDGAR